MAEWGQNWSGWSGWSGRSSGWSQDDWRSWNASGSSGSHDPQQPTQQNQDDPQQNQGDEDMEWDGGWVVPDPLTEAEITYRVRSTCCTPIEWSLLCDSEEEFEFPRALLSKVTRHWGKPNTISETKTLLSCVCNKRNFAKGEALEPGTVGFILSKSLIAASRHDFNSDHMGANTCYCLPLTYMEGCRHGCPPVYTTRLRFIDTQCSQCTKCLRCGKFLA